MSTDKKKSKVVGCLSIAGFAFSVLFFYLFSNDIINEIKHSICPPIRVYITKPGWGCDDNDESFSIVKTEYPSYWSKKVFPKKPYLKPFPRSRRGDTADFRNYYKKINPVKNDTIMLIGRFGLETVVGIEKSFLYRCQPIPYFEAQSIYTKHGKLIKSL